MDKPAIDWMTEAIWRCTDLRGRARRKEYWWFQVFAVVVGATLVSLDAILFRDVYRMRFGVQGPFSVLGGVVLALPNLAVSVRRLHDRDRSGWWLGFGLVPIIGFLVLLFWFLHRGTVGQNRFGADPYDV
jgi:uncharacterized membrane protein YhaH (DUF805 family)